MNTFGINKLKSMVETTNSVEDLNANAIQESVNEQVDNADKNTQVAE